MSTVFEIDLPASVGFERSTDYAAYCNNMPVRMTTASAPVNKLVVKLADGWLEFANGSGGVAYHEDHVKLLLVSLDERVLDQTIRSFRVRFVDPMRNTESSLPVLTSGQNVNDWFRSLAKTLRRSPLPFEIRMLKGDSTEHTQE